MKRNSRPRRTSADVYDATMADIKAQGIEARIYSHPIGNQGHGRGAAVMAEDDAHLTDAGWVYFRPPQERW